MRVIGGAARGLTLKGPPDAGTRATGDKVRGAIFNVLAPYVDGARVLDLYAGTGALGIEALSRGAAHATFVERRQGLCAVIRENLVRAHLLERAHIYPGLVHHLLSTLQGPYDLILADPPYDDREGAAIVGLPSVHALLAPDAILVLEHSPRVAVEGDVGPLRFVRTRRYGDSAVSYWQRQVGGGDD